MNLTNGRNRDLKGQHKHLAYLLLGGNLGNTVESISSAIDNINKNVGFVRKTSALYESEPWGMKDAPWFINQAVELETSLEAERLLEELLSIEAQHGRTRQIDADVYLSRTIDIDILYYDNEIIHKSGLTIPHPRLHLRRFALMAMTELVPDKIHPKLEVDQQTLLKACNDEGIVRKL